MNRYKKDANGKYLNVGDKVHILGRGNKVLYIIQLNEDCAGVSSDKAAKTSFGVNYDRLVKFKNQK